MPSSPVTTAPLRGRLPTLDAARRPYVVEAIGQLLDAVRSLDIRITALELWARDVELRLGRFESDWRQQIEQLRLEMRSSMPRHPALLPSAVLVSPHRQLSYPPG